MPSNVASVGSVGKVLGLLRDSLGHTQEEIAARLKVSRSAVAHIERTETVRLHHIAAYADVLECDIEVLHEAIDSAVSAMDTGVAPNMAILRAIRRIPRDATPSGSPSLRGIPVVGVVPGGPTEVTWARHEYSQWSDETIDRTPSEPEQQAPDLFAVRVVGDSLEPDAPAGTLLVCKPIPRDADGLPDIEGRLVVIEIGADDGDLAGDQGICCGVWRWRNRPKGLGLLEKLNPLHSDIKVRLDAITQLAVVIERRAKERPRPAREHREANGT